MGKPAYPEAALLNTARLARRLSLPDAAARAGVSHQTWGRVERSDGNRAGADTIAHMAHAVGIASERLASIATSESDNHLRRAAEVLREIEMQGSSGSEFQRWLQSQLREFSDEERVIVEELLSEYQELQQSNARLMEKIVVLFRQRKRGDHGDGPGAAAVE
ncbi:MAG TPA: helix-turn-helix domain-containing protein [Streptosporangiaceae bacterium]|jgi:transcriptional regulator with XRE-family HTH domain|nr:helix-turn-helix domain-containing protein [Streptosporangiaceae bacterium]